MTVPINPINPFGKESSRTVKGPRYLLKRMIWLLVGLTSLTALYYDPLGRDYALYALIPAGVGVTYLLYYAVEGRKEEEQARNTQERRTLRETFKP